MSCIDGDPRVTAGAVALDDIGLEELGDGAVAEVAGRCLSVDVKREDMSAANIRWLSIIGTLEEMKDNASLDPLEQEAASSLLYLVQEMSKSFLVDKRSVNYDDLLRIVVDYFKDEIASVCPDRWKKYDFPGSDISVENLTANKLLQVYDFLVNANIVKMRACLTTDHRFSSIREFSSDVDARITRRFLLDGDNLESLDRCNEGVDNVHINLGEKKLSFIFGFGIFWKLRNFKSLALDHNQIKILPPDVGSCAELEYLYLQRNQLSTLPVKLLSCSKLRYLLLNLNRFTSLPEFLLSFRKLETLEAVGNPLTTIPRGFFERDWIYLSLPEELLRK
jgi:hypothetical protein